MIATSSIIVFGLIISRMDEYDPVLAPLAEKFCCLFFGDCISPLPKECVWFPLIKSSIGGSVYRVDLSCWGFFFFCLFFVELFWFIFKKEI